MTKAELAKQNFLNGCNCAQAVLLAFSDETGLDRATALRLTSGLGGGMARMREVCGTVNGMFLAAGLILGSDDTADRAAKSELYRRLQGLAERVRARNGIARLPRASGRSQNDARRRAGGADGYLL